LIRHSHQEIPNLKQLRDKTLEDRAQLGWSLICVSVGSSKSKNARGLHQMSFKHHRASRQVTLFHWIFGFLVSACLVNSFRIEAATISENQRSSNKTEEKKIAGKIAESVASAWNKNDTESIAKLFAPDAVLITPNGSVVRSRAGIRKRIIDERNGKLKDTTLRSTVEAVSMPNGTTAVVKGKYQLEGMKVLGVETSPEGSFILHQTKQQGRWMIAKAEIHRKESE
jgi:uncharacterized protein (TIGR02246 family)